MKILVDIDLVVRRLVYAGYTVVTVWTLQVIHDRSIIISGATEHGYEEFIVSANSAVTETENMSIYDIIPGDFVAIKIMPQTGYAHITRILPK